jgi:hypothetical protein
MRDAGSAIAPFGSMAPVFLCRIPPHCTTMLANQEANSPGAAFPSPI